jgi:hypothetical protein
MSNQNEKVVDDQTGQTFTLIAERWFDVVAAWFSVSYSLATIVFLGFLLLDTWTGKHLPWFMQWYKEAFEDSNRDLTTFKLVVYTAIGGGIGAAVNNIRSFVHWHAELKAFGWRFVWKYIALPPLGATLAVMVYAIIRGGIAMFNGGKVEGGTITTFSAWATGTLAGYGSHKVFIWLDDKVNTLFKVEEKSSQTAEVTVPDLSGKTPDEAEQALKDGKLALGEVSKQKSEEQKVDKVISQTPAAGTNAAPDSKVAITIGIASDTEGSQTANVDVPDVSGKTRDEAEQALKDGKLSLGEVSKQKSEEQKVGKVISQTPAAGTKAAPDSKVAITIGIASDGK